MANKNADGRMPQSLGFSIRTSTTDRNMMVAFGLGAMMTFAPGQIIVLEGDLITDYYRIVTGTVRLYKGTADGRRQIIDFLGANEYFGLTNLAIHHCSVEAISAVTAARHPLRRLEQAIKNDPKLSRSLFKLACLELSRSQRHMLLLGRKNADERLASFLLDMANRQGRAGAAACAINLPMSRLDVADYLGLTIETVSRLFTRFKQLGAISPLGTRGAAILDLQKLQLWAEGCPQGRAYLERH